ncbi:MAG TPA: hypothetical protein VG713_09585 [Pirellulales bacterium]|nr:hypothetical protein [Pirellulales bacterium]
MLDPLRLTIALTPLGLYFVLIGVLHRRRRPTIVSGARDLALLGAGTAGLALVGPIELFMPRSASIAELGPYLWAMLLTLYSLCVSLAALAAKPRLVIYGSLPWADLRIAIAAAVGELDSEARWAGTTVSLPHLQIEFYLDWSAGQATTVLTATTRHQNLAAWQRLHQSLAGHLPKRTERSWCALGWLAAGGALLAIAVRLIATRGNEMIERLYDVLHW